MGSSSGLALHDDMIFTNDNRTGRIGAFAMDGNLIDYLDDGSLIGIEFDAAGNLWLVDAEKDEFLLHTRRRIEGTRCDASSHCSSFPC
ncbi:MAG: hypothetical protein KDA24_08525 [Deltaproteobacteria bacterium]|nr:hypothetical protein [Deltaproteobacteria bacterium]